MTTDLNPLVPSPWEVLLLVGGLCLIGAVLILLVVKLALRRSTPDRAEGHDTPHSQRPSAGAGADRP
jgi:hypothetical protein